MAEPRLAIFGVGLIGGSLALALRQAGKVGEIVGCSRRPEHLQQAVDLGVIDRFTTDPAEAVRGADFVMVTVPLGSMEPIFAAIAPHLEPHAIVTDGGSAKASVVRAARPHLGARFPRFVPGHPIAGAEKSGVTAARGDLYQQHRVILTPVAETEPDAVAAIRELWQHCGAEVVTMEVEHHDRVLAATSHLPHLLAFALVDQLAEMQTREEIFRFAAGGFRDFTRIAASDPVMWRDICMANRDAVLDMLTDFEQHLGQLRAAMEREDADAVQKRFTTAKQARDQYTASA